MAGVSIGVRTAICSECGADLVVHKVGAKPQPEDRVTCPVHGDVGSYADVGAAAMTLLDKAVDKKLGEAFGYRLN